MQVSALSVDRQIERVTKIIENIRWRTTDQARYFMDEMILKLMAGKTCLKN